MDELSAQKQNLRQIFKTKRAALSADEVTYKSQKVAQNFITNLLPKIYPQKSDKIFSLYLAAAKEVETDLIAQHFRQNNIYFAFPKIIKKDHPLDFVLAQENQAFVPNSLFSKIVEPQDGPRVDPDFIILPLLAFDGRNSRLGMGGGFFDRSIELLKSKNPQIITIGLAYDFQGSEAPLPTLNTDQRLDFIVTESRIFSAS